MKDLGGRKLVLFDGFCGLCNGFVDFAMKRDGKARLLFAPLQGKTAEELAPGAAQNLEALLLWDEGKLLKGPPAVFVALGALNFPWNFLALGRFFPQSLQNWIYEGIAKNRYQWFGKRDQCRLPSPEEKERFLP